MSTGVKSYFGSNLTLNSGAVLDFNLSNVNDNHGPNNGNDHIVVSGALSLSGGTINVNDYDGSLQAGNYDLIGYAGLDSQHNGLVVRHGAWIQLRRNGRRQPIRPRRNCRQRLGHLVVQLERRLRHRHGNWQPGTYPNGPGQIATFGLGTQANVSVSASYTVGELLFNNSTTGYDLTGGNLTLDNSGSGALVSVATSTPMPTILTSLTLADSSHSTTFNVASGSSLDITGTVGESSMVTNQKVVLTGGGILFMEANNTYSGGTTIQNGTLTLLGAGVPGTGSLTFNPQSGGDTATLNVNASIGLNNLSETPGSAGSAKLNVAPSTTLTLTQTASANFAGSLSLGSGAALVVAQKQRQHADPRRQADVGQRQFGDGQLGHALLGQQHRGQHHGQRDGDGGGGRDVAIGRLGGGTIEFGEHHHDGHRHSNDGALTLVGTTTQTVGVISGTSLSVPGITSYAGNTTVGDGTNVANLTATQILQNTLTIGAGSTVTLAPSAPLSMVVAANAPANAPAASALPLTAESDAITDGTGDPLLAIQAAIASGSISNAAGELMENRIAALKAWRRGILH